MAKRKKKDVPSEKQSPKPGDTSPSPVPLSENESSAAPHDAYAAEQDAMAQDWAARVGADDLTKNEPDRPSAYPDPNVPFSIVHDNQAGVRLLKSERYKQVQLAFSSPVSGDIEGQLVAAGWRYRPEEKVYTKQYGESGAGTSMFEAKRLYDDLVQKLLDEKGISRSNSR